MLPLILSASLPDILVSEMEILLAKGTNPTPPSLGFNDPVIADDSLLPVIAGSESNLGLQNRDTIVAEGITVLRMTFTGAKYSESQSAKLSVEVCMHHTLSFNKASETDHKHPQLQVFHTNGLANAALIHALSEYQVPNLSETFDRPSPALGNISLVDKYGHSLYLVRENICLSLKLSALSPEATFSDVSQIEQLQPIAQRLDSYLSIHTLPPEEHRKPALQLMTPASSNTRIGDAVSLQAQGDDFAAVDGTSENCAAIICAGRRQSMCALVCSWARDASFPIRVSPVRRLRRAGVGWRWSRLRWWAGRNCYWDHWLINHHEHSACRKSRWGKTRAYRH